MTLVASSEISKQSIVAIKAIRPATLACTKESFRALENAGTSTLRLVLYPRVGPSRPIRIQVFVLIEASESVCIFASNLRRSLFMIRSESYRRELVTYINRIVWANLGSQEND